MNRLVLLCAFLALGFNCLAYHVYDFSPEADELNCAYFEAGPVCIGGVNDGQNCVFYYDGNDFTQINHWVQLPITGLCPMDYSVVLASIGAGSYSDGVYNLNLDTQTWTLNEWFFRPQFVKWCASSQKWYVGEQEGLFQSSDGATWSRIANLGMDMCTSFDYADSHLVTNIGPQTFFSNDAGATWLLGDTPHLQGYRFTWNGPLYAFMNCGSDSDGLWKSVDFGATWDPVYYTTGLSSIGPSFYGHFALGWETPNEWGSYAALSIPTGEFQPLVHDWLNLPVKQIDIFTTINTPSFYILNSQGCYYVTQFLTVPAEDEVLPPPVADFQIYPNPCSGSITARLDGNKTGDCEFSLYDLRGRLLRRLEGTPEINGEWTIPLPSLSAGVYLLRADSLSGQPCRRLFISQ